MAAWAARVSVEAVIGGKLEAATRAEPARVVAGEEE